jgi:hypothetical protein
MNRKEKFISIRSQRRKKAIIASAFTLSIIGGSMSVTFADQDVHNKLSQWFEDKKNEAINEISLAIMNERELQKGRLQEEIKSVINGAETDLNIFTASEKEKRRQAIRNHADSIIASLNIDNEEEKAQISSELDVIVEDAIQELNRVSTRVSNPPLPTAPENPAGNEEQNESSSAVEQNPGDTGQETPPSEHEGDNGEEEEVVEELIEETSPGEEAPPEDKGESGSDNEINNGE